MLERGAGERVGVSAKDGFGDLGMETYRRVGEGA
jgi:hypothetical protein